MSGIKSRCTAFFSSRSLGMKTFFCCCRYEGRHEEEEEVVVVVESTPPKTIQISADERQRFKRRSYESDDEMSLVLIPESAPD
jgi:hypothetical protein